MVTALPSLAVCLWAWDWHGGEVTFLELGPGLGQGRQSGQASDSSSRSASRAVRQIPDLSASEPSLGCPLKPTQLIHSPGGVYRRNGLAGMSVPAIPQERPLKPPGACAACAPAPREGIPESRAIRMSDRGSWKEEMCSRPSQPGRGRAGTGSGDSSTDFCNSSCQSQLVPAGGTCLSSPSWGKNELPY